MDSCLELRILTPYSALFEGRVRSLILQTVQGEVGIRCGHAPYSALLAERSLITLDGESTPERFVALGATVTVWDNCVTVLADVADLPEQIDQTVALLEQERRESERLERRNDFQVQQAEMNLRRALVNRDVSAYSIIKGRDETDE